MKPYLKTGLRILSSGLVLAFLLWWVELDAIVGAMKSAESLYLLLALLLVPLNLGSGILVWWLLLAAIEPKTKIRSAAAAVLAGFSLALFTPARLGDAGARLYYHRLHGGIQVAAALATEGLYRALVYLVGGTAALIIAIRAGILDSVIWTPVATAAAIGAVVALIISVRPSRIILILDRIPFASRLSPHFRFLNTISARSIPSLILLSAVRYVVMITQFSLLMIGFGVTADHLQIAAGGGFVFLVKFMLPNLFFTDLGIREGAAAFIFEQMGGFGAAAVSAALSLYAINLVLPALLGAPYVRKTSKV